MTLLKWKHIRFTKPSIDIAFETVTAMCRFFFSLNKTPKSRSYTWKLQWFYCWIQSEICMVCVFCGRTFAYTHFKNNFLTSHQLEKRLRSDWKLRKSIELIIGRYRCMSSPYIKHLTRLNIKATSLINALNKKCQDDYLAVQQRERQSEQTCDCLNMIQFTNAMKNVDQNMKVFFFERQNKLTRPNAKINIYHVMLFTRLNSNTIQSNKQQFTNSIKLVWTDRPLLKPCWQLEIYWYKWSVETFVMIQIILQCTATYKFLDNFWFHCLNRFWK